MSGRTVPGDKGRVTFRIVALAALVAAVGQVVLGGVVRVTGSGLGCPDWPLCDGRVIPSLELPTLIEYSHRLSATVLGILALSTTWLALRSYRAEVPVIVLSALALALVVVAAILGGITVLTELAWWMVLLHLGIAELVVACLVVVVVATWSQDGRAASWGLSFGESDRFRMLVIAALVGLFAVILFGSYMVGLGYGSACGTWPLCKGSVLPSGEAFLVHMSHRMAAGLVGVLIAAVALTAWLRRTWRPELLWPSLFPVGLFVVQALVGAGTVWTGFSSSFKSLHLGMATLLWMSLVLLAALTFAPRRLQPARDMESQRKSAMQRVAP